MDRPEHKPDNKLRAYTYPSSDQKQLYRYIEDCCSLVFQGSTPDPKRAKAKT